MDSTATERNSDLQRAAGAVSRQLSVSVALIRLLLVRQRQRVKLAAARFRTRYRTRGNAPAREVQSSTHCKHRGRSDELSIKICSPWHTNHSCRLFYRGRGVLFSDSWHTLSQTASQPSSAQLKAAAAPQLAARTRFPQPPAPFSRPRPPRQHSSRLTDFIHIQTKLLRTPKRMKQSAAWPKI